MGSRERRSCLISSPLFPGTNQQPTTNNKSLQWNHSSVKSAYSASTSSRKAGRSVTDSPSQSPKTARCSHFWEPPMVEMELRTSTCQIYRAASPCTFPRTTLRARLAAQKRSQSASQTCHLTPTESAQPGPWAEHPDREVRTALWGIFPPAAARRKTMQHREPEPATWLQSQSPPRQPLLGTERRSRCYHRF